jgi:hypothetical protein
LGQYWRLLGKRLLVGDRWKELLLVVLSSGAMGAVLLLLRRAELFVSVGVGIVLYAAFLLAFRAVTQVEYRQLFSLLLKRGKAGGR